jgi:DNA-binding response OmpR family regulator
MHQILIVETDAQIRRLLERWIAEAGYSVIDKDSMAQERQRPDLVIAGLGPTSSRVAERVDELRRTHHAPLLLVSARFRRGLAASRSAATLLGVQAVLPTPFNQAELLTAICAACAL